jgi:oligopeptide/dipeptide ABC transporter ATP-binding protein
MTAPLLDIRGLSVQYRRRRAVSVAVDDVSFAVSPGETVGVVGESGSGKTTITRAILGLTATASGEVLFGGQDVTRLDAAGRRRLYRQVQLVFQDPYSSLNPSRTVGRTLAEPLQAYGQKDAALVRTRVREMLERVQLPEGTADRYPGELSGGQRQRVAIARALMLSPQLVILDEPLSALDLSAQAQILNLLRELQASAGVSYLFISHDLEVVRYLCDRVVVMYQGRVMETGPADLVAGQSAHPYTRMLHQASPVPDPRSQRQRHATEAALSLPESAQRHPASGDGCKFAPRCPFAVSRCWTEPPPRQAAPGGGEVACHRFPEWRDEIAPAGQARSRPGSAVPHARANGEAAPAEPGRANVVEGALRGQDK